MNSPLWYHNVELMSIQRHQDSAKKSHLSSGLLLKWKVWSLGQVATLAELFVHTTYESLDVFLWVSPRFFAPKSGDIFTPGLDLFLYIKPYWTFISSLIGSEADSPLQFLAEFQEILAEFQEILSRFTSNSFWCSFRIIVLFKHYAALECMYLWGTDLNCFLTTSLLQDVSTTSTLKF